MNSAKTLSCAALALWLGFGLPGNAAPQDDEEPAVRARRLAASGRRREALDLLERRLAKSPEDIDARLVYGIMLSWEGRYSESRTMLEQVLARSPDYEDARAALINVELWSGNAGRAERLAAEGQRRNPANVVFLLSRARALKKQKKEREALEYVENLLVLEPGNRDAQVLRGELKDDLRRWEAGVDSYYSWYSDGRSPWREDRLSVRGYTPAGSVAAHYSRARHGALSDQFFEFDAYPRIRPGAYAFVSGGYSSGFVLFPRYRLAADVYQNLPRGFEASAGFRHFRFRDPTNLYTASLAKYLGKWLITGRTFLSRDQAGLSHSIQIKARRYFAGVDRYATLWYGRGPSPFEVRSINEVGFLKSSSYFGELNWKLGGGWSFRALGGVSSQQRTRRNSMRQYVLDGAVFYRF